MLADTHPTSDPPIHCPACGVPMREQPDKWVCPNRKCGATLPKTFAPRDETDPNASAAHTPSEAPPPATTLPRSSNTPR
ncbi:MAG: hypothetical protein KGJ23_13075 [Euryarchaeota archaeon]|nr:hypothetical protein [Euryarchaeota archaeon]MDE2046158.1 hypothetical protein [Thermoplasmata archaeon]